MKNFSALFIKKWKVLRGTIDKPIMQISLGILTANFLAVVNPILANTYNVTTTSDFPFIGAVVSVSNAAGVINGGAGNGFSRLLSVLKEAKNLDGWTVV